MSNEKYFVELTEPEIRRCMEVLCSCINGEHARQHDRDLDIESAYATLKSRLGDIDARQKSRQMLLDSITDDELELIRNHREVAR